MIVIQMLTNSVAIFYSGYYLQLLYEDQSSRRIKNQGQVEQWSITSQQCKGSCQVEKTSKNSRKTRIGQTPYTHPPPLFHFFCFETFGNMETTQKQTKKPTFSKKKLQVWA